VNYIIDLPLEIGALSLALTFVFSLIVLRTHAESLYHKVMPWFFHFIGLIMFVVNIRGDTMNFDFLHLGILCFVTGLSLQLELLRSSSRIETEGYS